MMRNQRPRLYVEGLDPGTPTIDVIIGGAIQLGFQIIMGSSVNLMNVKIMNELGIIKVVSTTIV
jgi:hypothetical protein